MRTTRLRAAVVFLFATLAACTAGEDLAGPTGSVGLAIVATGSDGAVYRIFDGTRLELQQISEPGLFYSFSLDGDIDVLNVQLPPGEYEASIRNDLAFNTHWPMERSVGGALPKVVTADLVTPQPTTITVTSGETTSLVLQFTVGAGGTLVFDRGNLAVSVAVSAQPASQFGAVVSGSGDLTVASFGGPYEQALQAILPAAGTSSFALDVSGWVTGPWAEGGGADDNGVFICAPYMLQIQHSSGNDALTALLAESGHGDAPSFLYGPANICIIDHGQTNQVRIRLTREGAAETPTFAAVFGAEPVLFHNQILVDLPTRVYDSQNGRLDLDALLAVQGFMPMILRAQIRDEADLVTTWYAGRVVGQASFFFSAYP